MSYVGVPPFGQTVRTVSELVATAGQTAFTIVGGYVPGYIDVELNGVSLLSTDFVATNGTTVTLTIAAAEADELRAVAYWPVSLVDTYRKSEADAKFATPSSVTPAGISDKANTSTGYMAMPVGTTAQRPGTPAAGMFRMNSTTGNPEWYDAPNAAWVRFADPLSYSIEYLVVAGGGAGGGNLAGGGGGGGVLSTSSTVQAGSDYTVAVGAGGTGVLALQGGASGGSGTNSTFRTSVAIGGGGGGGGQNPAPALSGGSGGGGSGYASAAQSGSGTSGQGYAGGTSGLGASNYPGGGGGGGGAVGQTPASSSAKGGAGGAGVLNAINGSSLYWAGGGGGGAYVGGAGGGNGGIGGGGGGGCDTGTAGTGGGSARNSGGNGVSYSVSGTVPNGGAGGANTGGGGGGTGHNVSPGWGTSGNGGSGIVIIRYLGDQKGSGGTVTSAGGYTIHTFTTSGTYTA